MSILRTIVLYRNKSHHILTKPIPEILDIFLKLDLKSLENRIHHLGKTFYTIILQSNWYIDRIRLHTDLSPGDSGFTRVQSTMN